MIDERTTTGPGAAGPSQVDDPNPIDLTVVIPTFNRCDRLRRVLEALDRQRTIEDGKQQLTFDVIVVSDGSTDGTRAMVGGLETGYTLHFIDQPNAGPAAARNRGIEAAIGRIILFIDDDVVPAPECVIAHFRRHEDTSDLVVIGPMLTPPDTQLSPWVAWEQHQLYKQYDRFRSGERTYSRQFYTGNASVARDVVVACGGFDTRFRRAEDIELAYRMELAGQSFVFETRAEAFHYAQRSLASWLQMAEDYGEHDVDFERMGQAGSLDRIAWLFSERHPLQRAFIVATIEIPTVAKFASWLMVKSSLLAARLQMQLVCRAMLSGAYGVRYYGGVSSRLGSPSAFIDLVRGRYSQGDGPLRMIFVLEQTLGHVTHGKNLQSLIPNQPEIDPVFLEIDDSLPGLSRHVPGWSNWTVRAGVRARRALRSVRRTRGARIADVMFVHSQVPAILLGSWMRRLPTVVSLDATPRQYDELGVFYAHDVGSAIAERFKWWANRRCFGRAQHLITWSDWAKRGLVDHYGVSPDSVTVIPAGVDVDRWTAPDDRAGRHGPVRILFVGGDFERKGGRLLLEAAGRLRSNRDVPEFELHLVTNDELANESDAVVHRGLGANSPLLIQQFHLADIFCLPTLGDCLPMVLAEAGAAGLPLISTDVGAISEVVRDEETGRLICPGDLDALVAALEDLLISRDRRLAFGRRARMLIEDSHDARVNAGRIVTILRSVSTPGNLSSESPPGAHSVTDHPGATTVGRRTGGMDR